MSVSEEPSSAVRTLANGVEMPLLGLGVWRIPAGTETEQAVKWALEDGYRHIDTAQLYRNEQSVGAAVEASGLPRGEVFITTKLEPRNRDALAALNESLERLRTDYVDLFLIHWPTERADAHWEALEQAYDKGSARAIGVSNWSADQLRQTSAKARIRPHVNQVQFSPFEFRKRLLEACDAERVVLEAYSPLTRGKDLHHPTVLEIAARHERTPAQVLLRWALEREIVVIPKSVRQERIRENAQIFDFALRPEDVDALDALDRTGGTADAR